ncbi:asparagine synthase (glutamine-hydrolyzing) [Lacinutrix sp. C3R15]|uniref:asparagine synthase (glutamine-hydrolyzing) n=1 Tax=Flavobacteriaceae TaxID=49546 RepID=UPI001C097B5C|nr:MULTISPECIES: asparagine synthase (glutamine-hydrolyzing) [Flavobacteriaceae]MBU2938624.1 asparagine synthase (glutamine-hydrolyzing) [Lacinutrix sp. C3R15]MDO6621938.1 asparagine synthase (glutamine-hydrolyzing) [Oceanihabitans sp. 1_MG-2023]
MCGINGIISRNSTREKISNSLQKMNQLIYHRGPDEDGFCIENHQKTTVAMAMRRLSIIDLSTGKQPIYNNDKSIIIVFNGEIYNYQILKKQLEDKGITFKTKSDTEVILKLYETQGESSFAQLDGMFAFSIYDKNRNKVFISRDFFGEKPLYYYNNEHNFFWASELKSIINNLDTKPEISKQGLNLYFRLTYTPAPFTIYKDIFKLEANHYIDYDLNENSFTIHKINTVKNKKQDIAFAEAKKELKNRMLQSIESRSISDVPLGTFLSGGVDSSIVSFGLSQINNQKIDTFSIGFDKASFDETDKSKLVAKLINSNHHEFIISEKDIEKNIHEILLNFDEPFADSSALPTYLVAKKTRDFVKVALTGDGGDEVFGGYNKYYIGKLNSKYTSLVPAFLHNASKNVLNTLLTTKDDNRGKRFKLKKFVNAINYNNEHYWNIISLGFSNDTEKLLKAKKIQPSVFNYYKEKSKIEQPKTVHEYREIDRFMSLEGDMLVKVDRTSMLNSLECRAPFLNKSLWEFANSLPEDYLLKGFSKKHILKEAFKEEFPEGFLEKSKKGFVVPVGDWLRSGLRKELESYIKTPLLEKQNLFNIDYIQQLVKNHLNGKVDNSYKVWTFYTFQKWYINLYIN